MTTQVDNVQILNSIRAVSSSEYQARIPQATKTNLTDVMNKVMTYKATKEEFTDMLLNKVVKTMIMNKLYTNPYKFFKKEPLPVGKTIEMIFVDIIQAKSFGDKFGDGTSEASSLLSIEKPNLKVEYHEENYKHKYKVSVSDERIKSAFLETSGIQTLASSIVQSALSSAEYDEFLLIKGLLNNAELNELAVTGYNALTNENEKSKIVTKKIKTLLGQFKFLSTNYNKQGVHTHANASDIVIFVTPETSAMIDVELLATAFNMQKAEIEGRITLIDKFEKEVDGTMVEDTDTIAIVCDMDLIQLRDSLNTSESFRNPDTLTTNMFFHRWGSATITGFVNAVKVKKA